MKKIINVFDIGILIGYSAVLSKETLALELEHPNIRYIEGDQVVTLSDTTATQSPATWGIDRTDQEHLPLSNSYTYWASGGEGVFAYIIDTGILLTHTEFSGRAVWGFNSVTNEGDFDGNGHGTHVAGTIGGSIYGLAKKATLVAVKVLNSAGSGSWAGVVAGVDYVTREHARRAGRSVANMSLGGGATPTLDTAVEQSIAAGVHHVVAAGNSGDNACYYSPARVPGAVTAGATGRTDTRTSWSNFGNCVDIFAPGESITSAWIGSNTATSTISGTSMASPHVAGAIVQYLGHLIADNRGNPSPVDVDIWIKNVATDGKVINPGSGSPTRLLYSPFSDV